MWIVIEPFHNHEHQLARHVSKPLESKSPSQSVADYNPGQRLDFSERP